MRVAFALPLVFVCACAPVTLSGGRGLPLALEVSPGELEPVPATGDDSQPAPSGAPVPTPTRFALKSGVDVFLVEEAGAPLTTIDVLFGCGRADDPPGLAGLGGVTLDALLSTGAGALDAEQQARARGKTGAWRLVVGDGEWRLSVRTRASDFHRAVSLVVDLLRRPRFDPAALAQLVDREASESASPQAKHQRLVDLTRRRALFGPASSLSVLESSESLRSLTREQVLAQYAKCVQPRMVSLAISGAVSADDVRAAFGGLDDWAAAPVSARVLAQDPPRARRLFLVPSESVHVVKVVLAGPGLPAGTSDHAAAVVFMSLMRSWLTFELRSELGAVYHVDGAVEVGPGRGATWVTFTTRREHARQAVQRALALLDTLWQRWPYSDANVKPISSAVGAWWAQQSSQGFASDAARAARQGSGQLVAERLEAVKMHDLRRVFVETLKPGTVQIIISGALPAGVDWSQFAPVTRVEP